MAVDWSSYRLAPDFSGLAAGIQGYFQNRQAAEIAAANQAMEQQKMGMEQAYRDRMLALEEQKAMRGANTYAPRGQTLPIYGTDKSGNVFLIGSEYDPNTQSYRETFRSITNPGTKPDFSTLQIVSQEGLPTVATGKAKASAEEKKLVGEQEVKIEGEKQKVKSQVKLATEPSIAKSVELAKAEGKALGEDAYIFGDLDARMPYLYDTAKRLGELSQTATYTKGGQISDEVIKQFGFQSSPGADARSTYISIIDNEVLPLLRTTFGAAFTVEEGNRLRNTLGDPDASPKQKRATLDAFIRQKENQIKMLGQKLGKSPTGINQPASSAQQPGSAPNVIDFGSLKR